MTPAPRIRVGQGLDVHAFAAGRALVLGGVDIAWDFGLAGHSDGDVVVHAVCDALLGAAGLGDLGTRFPASDPALVGVASTVLLAEVGRALDAEGYEVGNVDVSIACQKPRLAPYISLMEERLASILHLQPSQVRVGPKSPEGLGFVGREEGIAALAVCLLFGMQPS